MVFDEATAENYHAWIECLWGRCCDYFNTLETTAIVAHLHSHCVQPFQIGQNIHHQAWIPMGMEIHHVAETAISQCRTKHWNFILCCPVIDRAFIIYPLTQSEIRKKQRFSDQSNIDIKFHSRWANLWIILDGVHSTLSRVWSSSISSSNGSTQFSNLQ